jgi:hypothetical protein
MDDMKDQFADTFHVNLQEVVKSKESMAVTKMLAAELMVNPYKPIKEFFESISDTDLNALLEAGEREEYSDMILLGTMLATAEGLDSSVNFDTMKDRCDTFYKFLLIESLARKGLVRIYRENLSFGEDMGDKIIVEKIGDDFA